MSVGIPDVAATVLFSTSSDRASRKTARMAASSCRVPALTVRTVRSARRARAGSSSTCRSASVECRAITASEFATESCRSRAMRTRSSLILRRSSVSFAAVTALSRSSTAWA
ncbi:hypothetical protein BC477_07625 [Clavibacter michiganensis subsp. michiganensis]|uniref:Uncharacterized protein n=1 Tax=Clavibacter michiganensis subsp. michiganensis TaxID=33013 RepID=A0A251XNF5_CLAMM|nr:hypothetical protein BC477_07625 [Clavibacter michiganensis subsp. michiganensis]OUE04588.1 hypothetical protein CMMCAS07_06555 [Clavibacter michiganensis subsp. michiganensis]